MRYAKVAEGVVVNVVVAEPDFAAEQGLIPCGPETSKGDFWDGTTFSKPAKIISSDMVKQEAYRRIIAICPEWKQRNLTAQAAQLAKKGEANWTPEEQAAWDAGEAIWNQIAAIRAKSDLLEAMNPIPVDYTLDTYWT